MGDTPTITVKLKKPHPGQQRIIDAQAVAQYVTAVPGRRFGKTSYGVRRVFKRSVKYPAPYRTLWCAPTYDSTTEAIDQWKELIPSRLFHYHKTDRIITLYNGARIFFRSADNEDGLRGRGFNDAVIDEAARIKEDIFKGCILPALADRNGTCLVITTPRGKRNWVYKWYKRGLDELKKQWRSVAGPTTENPLPAIREWVEQMKPESLGGEGGMPEDIYSQEILAQFLEDAAAVFSGFRACVNPELRLLPWNLAKPDVIGVDLAKHQDFTVLTGLKTIAGIRGVVAWERFHHMAWPLQADKITQVWKDAGRPLMILDSTGIGDPVADMLIARGVNRLVPYHFTNETKGVIIGGLKVDVEGRHVEFPDLPVLLTEMEDFGYEITKHGNFTYGAPEGGHDDSVISLALANHGVKLLAHYSQGVQRVDLKTGRIIRGKSE